MSTGKLSSIIVKRQGRQVKYNDFSDVLNFYYSDTRWTYGNKKELKVILDIRNSVVHNGLKGVWDEELATTLIKCVSFLYKEQ